MNNIGVKIFCYTKASRIEGSLVAAVFLLIGAWYSSKSFSTNLTIISLISVIALVSSGSLINYVYDRGLDEKSGKNIDFFNFVSQKEIIRLYILLNVIGLILLLYIDITLFAIGIVIFIVFLIYSAPPIRLKTLPPLDCIINGLGFGVLPFLLGVLLFRKELNFNMVWYSIIIGMVVISYYLLISFFDIEEDQAFGIKNSCTKLGKNRVINVAILLFFIATIISITAFNLKTILSISLLICTPAILSIKFTNNINHIRILISSVFILWALTITLLLSMLSHSLIPIFLFIIVLLITIQVIHIYLKEKS